MTQYIQNRGSRAHRTPPLRMARSIGAGVAPRACIFNLLPCDKTETLAGGVKNGGFVTRYAPGAVARYFPTVASRPPRKWSERATGLFAGRGLARSNGPNWSGGGWSGRALAGRAAAGAVGWSECVWRRARCPGLVFVQRYDDGNGSD